MSVVDLKAYKNKEYAALDEYEVLSIILNCGPDDMLIVTNHDNQLRITKVRASRFIIDPTEF